MDGNDVVLGTNINLDGASGIYAPGRVIADVR